MHDESDDKTLGRENQRDGDKSSTTIHASSNVAVSPDSLVVDHGQESQSISLEEHLQRASLTEEHLQHGCHMFRLDSKLETPENLASEEELASVAELMLQFQKANGIRKNEKAIQKYLDVEPAPDTIAYQRWRIATFLDQDHVKVFFIGIVFVNAIVMGIQTDNETESTKHTWLIVESSFIIFFTLELIMKFVGFGHLFFADHWNTLDFVVIVISIVEIIGNMLLVSTT